MAEYLLQKGANVNAQDKGGLIPLHNASSYGHMDLASLLIRFETNVNATDRWGYTPLHEAAQKGRTHLSALLLAHGADPFMRNQEGQTPLDLAAADDVRSLLQDAMMSPPSTSAARSNDDLTSVPQAGNPSGAAVASAVSLITPAVSSSSSPSPPLTASVVCPPSSPGKNNPSLVPLFPSTQQQEVETVVMPSGACLTFCPMESNPDASASPAALPADSPTTVLQLLHSLGLEQLNGLFEREDITLDVLCDMSHEDLRTVGVAAYGHRHKLIKAAQRIRLHHNNLIGINNSCTVLVELARENREFVAVEEEMQNTIREHRDNGHAGGIFAKYNVVKIQKVRNVRLWERYRHRREEVSDECGGSANERMLFHGSPFISAIVQKGFDERHAYIGGMFGAGIYFAEHSSKSNQYVYGIGGGTGCPLHKDRSCYSCCRQIVLCRVTLGRSFLQFSALKMAHAPPGHHSVVGRPSAGGLCYPEYVVYRGEQAYPEYLITYQIVRPEEDGNKSDPPPHDS